MKKYYLILVLLVISVILALTMGFNVGLKYSENTTIIANVKEEVNISDIKQITNEVFNNQRVLIQTVEVYDDVIQITVKSVTDEQVTEFKDKLNEKYGLELSNSDIIVQANSNTRLRTIVTPYIIPVLISFVLILAVEAIIFKGSGIVEILKSKLDIISIQVILVSIYLICRIPVNEYAILISVIAYIITEYLIFRKLLNEKTEKDSKKKK